MYDLKEIKSAMELIVAEMKDENLSDERFAELEKEYEALESKANREKKIMEMSSGGMIEPGSMNNADFRNLGEFVSKVVDLQVHHNSMDPRLGELRATQSMGEGTAGGFMVPTQFRPELLMVKPQDAIFRPRATVIPADPSYMDAEVTMPVLNQGAAENMYGGIVVEKVKEGGTKNATDFTLKEFSLIPHEVACYITVTDKLLRNWPGSSNVIGGLMGKAINGWLDTQCLSGNGVAGPHGCMHSGCAINYGRAAANLIDTADIIGMMARAKFGGSLVWVASQTTLTQLMTLQGGNNEYIWTASAVEGLPPTIFGIPVFFNDRSPALGSTGDLMLIDPSYYVIKDGYGPAVAASEHVYFTSNKTVIKIFFNVDGDSWLDEAIPLEGSTSNTVSPFIILSD